MEKAYLYADETGNTGNAIFDYPQYFMSAGIFSVSDIEGEASKVVGARCTELGEERLHASNLTEEINLQNLRLFLSFLKEKRWELFINILDKPYLASIVLFEIFFDPETNPAVPAHLYSLEPLRHMILGKLDYALSMEGGEYKDAAQLKRRFWDAFNKNATKDMEQVLSELSDQVEKLIPDKASKKIITDALTYGCAYLAKEPGFKLKTYTHKKWYKPYTPNMQSFAIINNEMHNFCEENDVVPGTFYHDQQSEFDQSMKFFHETMKHLHIKSEKPKMLTESEGVQYAPSEFTLSASNDIKMLQIVDCFLWVFQKEKFNETLEKEYYDEIAFIKTETSWHETSYQMSEQIFLKWNEKIPQMEALTPAQLAGGAALLKELYQQQQDKLDSAEKAFAASSVESKK